jgi:hypothetical protein
MAAAVLWRAVRGWDVDVLAASALDATWLRTVVRDELGDVRFGEEHHDEDDEDDDAASRITGVVRSIRAVTHGLRPIANRPPAQYEAAPGTGRVYEVIEAGPWAFEPTLPQPARSTKLSTRWRRRQTTVRIVASDPPDVEFAGWIVEVEVPQGTEA